MSYRVNGNDADASQYAEKVMTRYARLFGRFIALLHHAAVMR
jgi:hypothetical protein